MTITLDSYTIPERGPVTIELNRSFEIKVTAEEAQRQVNRWLLNEVSYMMHSDPPQLVIGERVVWRVPAVLTSPQVGQVGVVGEVDVDVETGLMDAPTECHANIIRWAEEIVAHLPPYKQRQSTPTKYLAKHIPPAPKLTPS
jgi:hypothetical protein